MNNPSRVTARAMLAVTALLAVTSALVSFGSARSAGFSSRPAQGSDAYELIDAVNALRLANGLPAYNVHSILMGVSQGHAEYMASTGSVTHYGPGGSRPYQRALAAGYPVAGNLAQGGYFSENIISGSNLTAQEAVQRWLGDAPHTNTMLSTYAQDIGAGVATVGERLYYVIDVGLSTGSTPRYTPGPGGVFPTAVYYAPLVSTLYPNTPAADGIVRHKVKPGETLWLIAITYGTKVDIIRAINGLAPDAPLRPGLDLVIFPAGTKTPPPANLAGPTMLSLIATATGPASDSGADPAALVPNATASITARPAIDSAAPPDANKHEMASIPADLPSWSLGAGVLLVGGVLVAAALFAFRAKTPQ
jgi:uncharacterized protein YkwD/LysM repeat protein